ncbi:DUF4232 domain-containing protein [Streptomyces humi]|uniref:DUF4232 domain-containing protein n=1 Tax=Streptomyces humi TaxID=1428620 RepID=UPI00062874A0|nr:DUF4232 domain-containing protein [Streptomyces humi]
MRTTRRLRLLAATGTAVAALALTACQDGTGTKDEGTAGSATATSTTASAAATPKASEGADGTSTGTGTGTSTGAGTGTSTGTGAGKSARTPAGTTTAKKSGGGQDDASADRVLCNGSNTAVRVQSLSRPLNHMLITVTNTGSKLCDLTYYPILRFDEMQWAPQGAKETQPQAVTTLAPGESGYAGVLLSAADGSGDGGTTGHKLTVAFQGMTPNSSGGASALPSLPAKGVYYDSSLQVTYWQQNRADALDW